MYSFAWLENVEAKLAKFLFFAMLSNWVDILLWAASTTFELLGPAMSLNLTPVSPWSLEISLKE